MQEPSLEGLQPSAAAPADTADGAPYTTQQKLAVAAGVAAIGAYVGYSLLQTYKAEPPQAIWAATPKATGGTGVSSMPQIAFVNLHDDAHPLAREGLRGWLDLHDEVQLTFPTVMFVEEEETSTFADIAGDVRRATIFAHKELQETQAKARTASAAATPQSPPSCLCTVVCRSVTEVEGQPLEDWDVEAAAVRRWHGKSFTQRHCLGFTVDGLHVSVLMQDVEGVLLTNKTGAAAGAAATTAGAATSSSSSSASAAAKAAGAVHDGASLLRECAVPSSTTFDRWLPPAVHRSAAATAGATSMMAFESSARRDDKAEAMKTFAKTGRPAALWRSAFPLFSLLGTVLRYNRADLAVYPRLLTATAVPTAPATTNTAPAAGAGGSSCSVQSRCWRALSSWPQRLSLPFHSSRIEGEGGHRERRLALSAPFLVLARAAEGSATMTPDALKEMQGTVAAWVRHFASLTPKHEAALVEVQREKAGQWSVRVDITRVRSTVVEAAWLMTHLVAFLTAVGVPLVNVQLVAVPEGPVKGSSSLLYPSADAESALHYWKPSKSSPVKSSAVSVSGKLGGNAASTTAVSAATQHPGWVSVELRAEKKMGFVVAQHDFATL